MSAALGWLCLLSLNSCRVLVVLNKAVYFVIKVKFHSLPPFNLLIVQTETPPSFLLSDKDDGLGLHY